MFSLLSDKKIIESKIIKERFHNDLMSSIEQHILDGWDIMDSPGMSFNTDSDEFEIFLYQIMVKYEEEK